jgi:hypothetical protein
MSFFKKLFGKDKDKKEKTKIPKKRTKTLPLKKAKKTGKDGNLKEARIERLSGKTSFSEKQKVEITASGHFPNLGWNYEKYVVEKQNSEIIVFVYASTEKGKMAAQALKPFNVSIKIKGLNAGKYQIKPSKGPAEPLKIRVEA